MNKKKYLKKIGITIVILSVIVLLIIFLNYTLKSKTKILKLGHTIDSTLYNTNYKTKDIESYYINFPETNLQYYNLQSEISEYVALLKEELNVTIDNHWKFFIHYYNTDKENGLIQFTYWIGDEIETSKIIIGFIDNHHVNTLYYYYLDKEVNENELLQTLSNFKNNTRQEKYNLSKNQKYLHEEIKYHFNYENNSLLYTYNLFFEENGVINNDIGCQYLVN